MARPTEADRDRALYVGACRIDLVRRSGTARLLSDARLATTVARALEAAGAPVPASVTIVLTDDAELTDLNRAHLERDEPTDVLSFPMLEPEAYPDHPGRVSMAATAAAAATAGAAARPVAGAPIPAAGPAGRVHIGDIAISVERAIDQAEAGRGGQTGDVRWSPADELRLLVTHGVLHLCGWDHAEPVEEAAMRSLEQRLLAEGRR
ncbi:MAG TPA: rRNA maturation RNase YbeY [Candidatus Acidoferrales bacterium]|nr:rRNA maturation RNase YbeY [Candidatus Acidoferrales bacterium]